MGNTLSAHVCVIIFVHQFVYVCGRWWEKALPCNNTVAANPADADAESGVDGFAVSAMVLTAASWLMVLATASRNFLNVQDFKVVTKEVKRWKEGEQDANVEIVRIRDECYRLRQSFRAQEVEKGELEKEVQALRMKLDPKSGRVESKRDWVPGQPRGNTRGPHTSNQLNQPDD